MFESPSWHAVSLVTLHHVFTVEPTGHAEHALHTVFAVALQLLTKYSLLPQAVHAKHTVLDDAVQLAALYAPTAQLARQLEQTVSRVGPHGILE